MTQAQALKTPAEVRAEFDRKGASIAAWARKHDLPPQRVYDVLQERNKGVRGKAHTAAVLLGIKDGDIPHE